MRRAIQTSRSSTTSLGVSRWYLAITNAIEVVSEDERNDLASMIKEMPPILSQILKNEERSLGQRRRSSKTEFGWFFEVVEWSSKTTWGA
jgi:hypothetical protein